MAADRSHSITPRTREVGRERREMDGEWREREG
jgi:hypothetical protein